LVPESSLWPNDVPGRFFRRFWRAGVIPPAAKEPHEKKINLQPPDECPRNCPIEDPNGPLGLFRRFSLEQIATEWTPLCPPHPACGFSVVSGVSSARRWLWRLEKMNQDHRPDLPSPAVREWPGPRSPRPPIWFAAALSQWGRSSVSRRLGSDPSNLLPVGAR